MICVETSYVMLFWFVFLRFISAFIKHFIKKCWVTNVLSGKSSNFLSSKSLQQFLIIGSNLLKFYSNEPRATSFFRGLSKNEEVWLSCQVLCQMQERHPWLHVHIIVYDMTSVVMLWVRWPLPNPFLNQIKSSEPLHKLSIQ